MKGYKGFKKGLVCKEKQYAENTVFEEGNAEICRSGMHFCVNPFDVWKFYPPCDKNGELNEFAEVETLDGVKTYDNEKFCTAKLNVGKKLTFIDFVKTGIETISNNTEKGISANTNSHSFVMNANNRSTITNTGTCSVATNTGDQSISINEGLDSVAVNTGDFSAVTNTGHHSVAINTGWQSAATNTRDYSIAITTACRSAAVSAGWRSTATNAGEHSIAINAGSNSVAVSTGNHSLAENTGDNAVAINMGTHSISAAEGENSIAFTAGYDSKVKGVKGSWLICAECDVDNNILCVRMAKVDGEKIKENILYTVKNGKFVEVE